MLGRVKLIWAFVIGLTLIAGGVSTGTAAEFYRGKTIRIIVGFGPGGGFDTYSRTVARHLGKHIPGKPSIFIQNKPGAGSLIAANYMYVKAKPDGLTIGHWVGGLVLSKYLGKKGIQFDPQKFEWVGAPVRASAVCALTKASGITNFDQWLHAKKPVKIGSSGPGGITDGIPRLIKQILNPPLQIVSGYLGGTASIRLAAERGEIDGGCWPWESIKSTWRHALETGDVNIVVQLLPKKHPELPDVANLIDYAKSDTDRQLINAGIHGPGEMLYSYSLSPGTPKERVKILQVAFMKTMKDPEFLADAKKSKRDINPVSGEEVTKIVAGYAKLNPIVVEKLSSIFIPKL